MEDIESEGGSRFKNIMTAKNILNVLLVLIILNLVFLDLILLQGGLVKTIEKIITNKPIISQTSSNDQTFCSQACITRIDQVQSTINNKQNIGVSLTPTPIPVKTGSTTLYPQSSAVKEYYVPFGSGSGSSADWQDVAGLEANVDSTAYGNIKSVVFEASLHIPTGNETASVRLYDSTDGHPVWNSEIDFNGNSSSVFMSSQPITLDSGNKLYTVQMLTQLQYTAILDQSRIHITTH